MALFRRRSNAAAASTANPVEEAEPTREGPYDIADVPETGGRLNLGALHIPPRPGMQLRIELDKNTKVPNSVTCTLGRSSVQIQLFAAPRSLSLWDDVRPLIEESARDKNGIVDDVPGVFGRELLVKLPVTTPGGSGTKSVRFAGIDGPRWMLRAVFHGEAALNRKAAEPLESLIRDIVVDRGREARPPREPIPLRLPGQEPVAEATAQEAALGVLRRGPEMTETR